MLTAVKAWIDDPATNHGFLIGSQVLLQATSFTIFSRESPLVFGTEAPSGGATLEIVTRDVGAIPAPEPATFSLLGLGIVGLIARRARIVGTRSARATRVVSHRGSRGPDVDCTDAQSDG